MIRISVVFYRVWYTNCKYWESIQSTVKETFDIFIFVNRFANSSTVCSQFSLRQRAQSCYWCFKIGEEVILSRYIYETWRPSFENNSVYFNVATVSIVMFLRSSLFWDIKGILDIFLLFFLFMTAQVGFHKSVKNGILTRISIAVL